MEFTHKAHSEIGIFPNLGERSNEGSLQEDDNEPKTKTGQFLPNPKKLPGPNNKPYEKKFSQITSLHEFGHMLGLNHPVCDSIESRCYGKGVSPDLANDVMGMGS